MIVTKGVIFKQFDILKSYKDYRANLRSAVRGFWNGTFSESEFIDAFETSINRQLFQAYVDTANKYGISEDEFTSQEDLWIARYIGEQLGYVSGFADIIAANKKPNGKLTPLLNRVDSWAARYNQVESNARTFFGQNQKLVWQATPGKAHCRNCGKLDGYVKRASQWADYPLEPGSPNLECGGFKCGCSMEETDGAMSRGALPRP